jgi:nitroreductase
MDFLTLSKKRYAVRAYLDQALSDEQMSSLLQAAQNAPTAHNNQPQVIIVAQSPEGLAIIDQATRGRFNAPVVFVVCYDRRLSWKRKDGADSGPWDASIIATHLMLEATDLGLGSIWIGMFKPEVLIEKLNLSEDIIPVALIPIGNIDPKSVPFEYHNQRRPLSETVKFI